MSSEEMNFQVADCFKQKEIEQPEHVISGFRRGVNEIVALRGCYTA